MVKGRGILRNMKRCKKLAALLIFIAIGCAACRTRQEQLESGQMSESGALDYDTEDISFQQGVSSEEDVRADAGDLPDSEEKADKEIEACLEQMSLEEKAAQLFIITPESLVGISNVTAASETTKEAFGQYPVGGFVYFENNLLSGEQVKEMLSNVQKYSMEHVNLPVFTCVDEEGGSVTRISGTGKFDVPDIENMSAIGLTKDIEAAYDAGGKIGNYLHELGFNVDFAPVADVLSNEKNTVVGRRSFGSDPDLVADMSMAVCEGLRENGVYAVLKHFPGHGATEEDSHKGYAYTEKSLEELQENELIPFQRGIDSDVSFIMAGHISLPNVTGDDTPASLSEIMIDQILRETMGYDGIVVTDAMNMGAIAQHFSASEAAVRALLAGADMILMPQDFYAAYQGVLEAVKRGDLSEERIDESVRRILDVKLSLRV